MEAERGRNAMMKMAEHTQKMGEQPSELSVEERNLLSIADKNVVGTRSAAWRFITSVVQGEDQGQQTAGRLHEGARCQSGS